MGAIDYLSLPIVPEILRSKVAILMELYQRRCELEELTHALLTARSHLQSSQATDTTATVAQTSARPGLDLENYDEALQLVSHDLRNALAPIDYLIELLLKETAATNPIRPVLQMVREYSLRISRLADDFEARVPKYPRALVTGSASDRVLQITDGIGSRY